MAVIKKDKIHGRIGNYIYRVVNGVEIIQAYPRSIKPSEGTKTENTLFGNSSQVSSKVYRLIKDFALNEVDENLYGNIMTFFKRNFFSKKTTIEPGDFQDWKPIAGTGAMLINRNLQAADVLPAKPSIQVQDGTCRLQLPTFSRDSCTRKLPADAAFISYGLTVVHYDFELESAMAIFDFDSERFLISQGFEAREIEVPMLRDGIAIDSGLLFVGFGLRFFASQQSFGYLNTKQFNPCTLLGVWYKSELDSLDKLQP